MSNLRDVPLFPQPVELPLVLSGTFEHLAGQRGQYARYRPVKRVACDECVAYLHARRGEGPLPRSARTIRKALGQTLRLCGAHTDLWRVLDNRVEGL